MGAGESSPAQASPSADDILYLGIDLGTSQSSIATSTGRRCTTTSVVGWPKDLISYKFLKKQVVIGEECLVNRMAVDMIWPLDQGVFRYQPSQEEDGESNDNDAREREAVDHLVTYVLELAEAHPGQEVRAVIGSPARPRPSIARPYWMRSVASWTTR